MNYENIRIANRSDALAELEGLIEYSSIVYEISDESADFILSRLQAIKDAIERYII